MGAILPAIGQEPGEEREEEEESWPGITEQGSPAETQL